MVTQYNPLQNFGKAITRGKFPQQAAMLYIPLDFTADEIIQVDMPVSHGIRNTTGLDGAQSVFIDNSANGSSVTLNFNNGFDITCPAYAAGVFPILVDLQGLKFIASSTGGAVTKTWFTNTREQPALWSTKIPIAGTINVSGSSIFSSPAFGNYIDHGASLAAANTSQQLLAANANRLSYLIKNPGTPTGQGIAAPEPAYINFGAAATIGGTASIELLPGETLTAENIGIVTVQQITWIAATAGHQLYCKEMES